MTDDTPVIGSPGIVRCACCNEHAFESIVIRCKVLTERGNWILNICPTCYEKNIDGGWYRGDDGLMKPLVSNEGPLD